MLCPPIEYKSHSTYCVRDSAASQGNVGKGEMVSILQEFVIQWEKHESLYEEVRKKAQCLQGQEHEGGVLRRV